MRNAKKTVRSIAGICLISTWAMAQEQTKPSAKPLPDAMELMQKFIDATGGKEAYGSVKTEAAKANMTFKQAGLQSRDEYLHGAGREAVRVVRVAGRGQV